MEEHSFGNYVIGFSSALQHRWIWLYRFTNVPVVAGDPFIWVNVIATSKLALSKKKTIW